MNKYECPNCGSIEGFDVLSSTGNLTTEAVLCQKCYHIWLYETKREEW
jgi:uncharacterized Zn finger protein